MNQTELLKLFLVISNAAALISIFLLFVAREYARKNKQRVRFFSRGIGALLCLLFLQYAVYADARYLEPNWVQVKRLKIPTKNYFDGLNKIKIAQISDLHIVKYGFVEKSLVEKTNALNPDIILITGDLLNKKEDLPLILSVVSKLQAKKGIYGIFGNHDVQTMDKDKLKTALAKVGVRILDNESARIPVNDEQGIWLIGLTNRRPEPKTDVILKSAYQNVNYAEPKILLNHFPQVIDSADITHENADLGPGRGYARRTNRRQFYP